MLVCSIRYAAPVIVTRLANAEALKPTSYERPLVSLYVVLTIDWSRIDDTGVTAVVYWPYTVMSGVTA